MYMTEVLLVQMYLRSVIFVKICIQTHNLWQCNYNWKYEYKYTIDFLLVFIKAI